MCVCVCMCNTPGGAFRVKVSSYPRCSAMCAGVYNIHTKARGFSVRGGIRPSPLWRDCNAQTGLLGEMLLRAPSTTGELKGHFVVVVVAADASVFNGDTSNPPLAGLVAVAVAVAVRGVGQ